MTRYCGEDGTDQPGVASWGDSGENCHRSLDNGDEELSRRLFGPLVDLKTGADGSSGVTHRSPYPSQTRPSFRQLLQLGLSVYRISFWRGLSAGYQPWGCSVTASFAPRFTGDAPTASPRRAGPSASDLCLSRNCVGGHDVSSIQDRFPAIDSKSE